MKNSEIVVIITFSFVIIMRQGQTISTNTTSFLNSSYDALIVPFKAH